MFEYRTWFFAVCDALAYTYGVKPEYVRKTINEGMHLVEPWGEEWEQARRTYKNNYAPPEVAIPNRR